MFFINFKNYAQAFQGFPKIYQDLEKVSQKYPTILTAFAPPPLLLAKAADVVKVPLWAQHLDPVPLGKFTGFLPAEALARVGAAGTFLNHSEHPLDPQELEQANRLAKEVGLSTLIFAATLDVVLQVKGLKPNYIAYEPPELISAGIEKGISVATAKPDIIRKAVEAAKPIPLLVGAGIFQASDIETSLNLGAIGGVVSSAIVTASQPSEVLDALLCAF